MIKVQGHLKHNPWNYCIYLSDMTFVNFTGITVCALIQLDVKACTSVQGVRAQIITI